MALYQNILLLLDCSPVDDVIVAHVRELAKYHHSKVHLFHVIHAHTLDQERLMFEKTEKSFAEIKSILEADGIDVTSSAVVGEPAEEVLKKSEEPVWDLVAMATHGHKRFSDFILGSVSEVLKHNIDKPLLMLSGKS